MENTITLIPSAAELTLHFRPEAETSSRFPGWRALVQDRSDLRKVDRASYVVGINQRTERIYGVANLAAVIVMAAALIAAFSIYLSSFVA
jgi:hypothetical protein